MRPHGELGALTGRHVRGIERRGGHDHAPLVEVVEDPALEGRAVDCAAHGVSDEFAIADGERLRTFPRLRRIERHEDAAIRGVAGVDLAREALHRHA